MTALKKLFLTFLSLSLAGLLSLSGQDPCFKNFIDAGKRALDQEQFQEAVDNFEGAQLCPGISEAQQRIAWGWIKTTMDANLKKQKDLYEAAEIARKEADEQREQADQARGEAEKNARLYQEQARLTEANRLGLLANIHRDEGEPTESLYLAYQGYDIHQDSSSVQVKQAFGQSVFEALADSVLFDTPLTHMQVAKHNDSVLVFLEDGRAAQVPMNQSSINWLVQSTSPFSAPALSGEGQSLVLSNKQGQLYIWNENGEQQSDVKAHEQSIEAVSISSDGQQILTCSRDHSARVWTWDGQQQALLSGHEGHVYAGVFSKDGDRILTRSSDATVRVWDSSGKLLSTLSEGMAPYVYDARFSPDGRHIVTASANGEVRQWTSDGELVKKLQEQETAILELLFSPDGKRLLTRSRDETAHLWDAEGALIATLNGHSSRILGAQFNSNGQYLLTFSSDGTALLWDGNGEKKGILNGHTAPIIAAEFSSDTQLILTTSLDGTSRLWDLNGNALMLIDLETKQPLASHFSADGNRLICSKGKQSFWTCPVPRQAFLELSAGKQFPDDMMQHLNTRYDIRPFQQ